MQIKKALVIGGGAMGGSIAHLLTTVGIECFVKDIDNVFVEKAFSLSNGVYEKLVAKGKLTPEKAEAKKSLIKGGIDYDMEFINDTDLVIEAAPEILKIKKQIFKELDKICPEKTIFATNTSSLSLTDIASDITRKDRFIGLHFFNPAHIMKLLEIIYDNYTSNETLQEMLKFAAQIDKSAIKCKNAPGFVVNRILIPYMNEALLALADGSGTMEEIDEAMVNFGMPMGPFALWDLVGLDVAMHASKTLEEAFGTRTPVPDLLKHIVDKKMFGQKTGKGFYDYTDKANRIPNAEVDKYLKKIWKDNPPIGLDFEPERLLAVQVREALLIAQEEIAGAHDIDTGMVYGTNFPTKISYGPLHWAEEVAGWDNIASLAQVYETEIGADRFKLPSRINDLADGGSIFVNCSYEVDKNGIAMMCVENPPMNVLSVKTVNDISNCMLKAISDPSVRVIILTGKGRAFVAGADIREFQKIMTLGGAKEYSERGQMMADIIENSDKPVICAINGFALGGGLELAMPCHIRIAAESAKLGLPEINLGIIPGFAGTQRLPRIVGKAKGLEMILTGVPITAQEALSIGLVNKVVPLSSLIDEAKAVAGIISTKGRIAVRAAMNSVIDGFCESFEGGCAIEADNFARVKVSADAVEGVAAFLDKRPAKFNVNSVVCIKQVPDTETLIKIDGSGTGIATDGVKWVMNPYDEFAVEEALKQKEKAGAGSVTIVSLGPDRAIETIRTALAMGADTGIHIQDADFAAKADPYATASALAAAIKGIADVKAIWCGKQAIDDDAAQVPAILGEMLGMPVVTMVVKFEAAGDKAIVSREVEGGQAVIEVPLPAIFSAQKGLNEPRYASLPGIMKAKKKPVDVKTAADLGVGASAKTAIKSMTLPPARQAGKKIEGDDADVKAAALAKALNEEAKVI